MRRGIGVALALSAVLAAGSGCMMDGGPGDGKDWFGNEVPAATEAPEACAVRKVQAEVGPYDPFGGKRPPMVPANARWVVYQLDVRAIGGEKGREYCVPFALHIHARLDHAISAPTFYNPKTKAFAPVPYDGFAQTPWSESYVIFAYIPSGSLEHNPPEYQIDLRATYLPERDVNPPDRLTAFRCSINQTGINRTMLAHDIRVDPRQGSDTVNCNLKSSVYFD